MHKDLTTELSYELKISLWNLHILKLGRPDSSEDKQKRDHKKLNRLAKDSIDLTRNPKYERLFRKLAMKEMLTIFTINIIGKVLELHCTNKESSIHKSSLLERVAILYAPRIQSWRIIDLQNHNNMYSICK